MQRQTMTAGLKIRLLIGVLFLIPLSAPAQLNPLQDRLAEATRLECRFAAMGRAQWDGESPRLELEEADLEVVFFDINTEDGTAEVEARYGGASYIVVRYSTGYLHLMQMFGAGPLFVTSVIAQETTDGRMMAVQNRVEYSTVVLPGFTSRPEVYVGDCAVS